MVQSLEPGNGFEMDIIEVGVRISYGAFFSSEKTKSRFTFVEINTIIW